MPKRKTLRRKTTKRKTRKGGVRLGSGMHGEVIYPGIACSGKDPKTYVTKVLPEGEMNEDYDEVKMRKVSAILKSIDPNQEYFIYPDFCNGQIGPLTKENEEDIKGPREGYEEGTYDTYPIGEFKSYNMKIGVTTFSAKWKEAYKLRTFYLRAAKDETAEAKYRPLVVSYLEKVLNDGKHLLIGLQKLHKAGILHNDINHGNILYMEDGKPRFIDFEECILNPKKKAKDDEITELIWMLAQGGLENAYPELYDEFKMKLLSP